MGNDANRVLIVASMLLASRNNDNDGTFNGDPEYVKRFAYLNAKPDFKPLIEYGFIEVVQDASTLLAKCDTEKRREETEKRREEEKFVFVLPEWIDKTQWALWLKTRKKKMIPEQMQMQVDKLSKWREAGLDHCGALANAAANGYEGLFLPKEMAKGNGEQAWWSSNETMLAKGEELGLYPKVGEGWGDFKGRIQIKIAAEALR